MMNRSELLKQSMEYAKKAGLHYVVPSLVSEKKNLGIKRMGSKNSFSYVDHRGHKISDQKTLARIRKLAIPPAYQNVWIASDAKAHLQVVGEDARGRKQYRYHPKWLEFKGETKYDRVLEFAHVLPEVRRVTESELKRHDLTREKVLATVVQLLEKTLIRIGNDEYAKSNHSYGLATLNHEHVKVEKEKIIFQFNGKSKIHHKIILEDSRLAKVVKECQSIRGRELFRYSGDDGVHHRIHAQDVNHYLKEITGHAFTAKDFRTWGATVYAALVFHKSARVEGKTKMNRAVNDAIDQVAKKLGNTRSICKKSYIHPAIIDAFIENKPILKDLKKNHEEQVLRFLKRVQA
jgi:DNA topoisomerase-1